MRIIPYKKIRINHTKNKDIVREIINSSIEPCKIFGYSNSNKMFCGHIEDSSFKIRRIIKYRNSFLPILKGNILDQEVIVTIRMNHFANIFMSIWMLYAVVGFIFSTVFIIVLLLSGKFEILSLPGLILAPAGFLMLKIGFWKEVKKAETELTSIINS